MERLRGIMRTAHRARAHEARPPLGHVAGKQLAVRDEHDVAVLKGRLL
jgi:hypothetical protein